MSKRLSQIVLFAVLLGTMLSVQTVSADDRILRIAPHEIVLKQIGEIVEIEVHAEQVQSLYGAEISLTFDSSSVEVVTAAGRPTTRVEAGDLLDTSSKFEAVNRVNNLTGTIEYMAVLLGNVTGKSGSGTVIRLYLRVKEVMASEIIIRNAVLVETAGDGQLVQVIPGVQSGRLLLAAIALPSGGTPQGPPPAENDPAATPGEPAQPIPTAQNDIIVPKLPDAPNGVPQEGNTPGRGEDSPQEVEQPNATLSPPIAILLTADRQRAVVNGAQYEMTAAPYLEPVSGRTMVPLRFISEALGATVDWSHASKQVRITGTGGTVLLTIDAWTVLINGAPQRLDCPARLKAGTTYVPLRLVSQALGAVVHYDATSRQILISRQSP